MDGRIKVINILLIGFLALAGMYFLQDKKVLEKKNYEYRQELKDKLDQLDYKQDYIVELETQNSNNEWMVDKIETMERQNEENKLEILRAVNRAASAYDLDRNLILAVIHRESNFDPYATSSANCKGLMQVNVSAWPIIGSQPIDPDKIYDIDYNVMIGAYILKSCIEQTKYDIPAALRIYWGGMSYKDRQDVDYHRRVLDSIYFTPVDE